MGIISFLSRSQEWNTNNLIPSWDKNREAIYSFIQRKNKDANPNLPDEDVFFKDKDLRWVAGGLDGAFGHHAGGQQQQTIAKEIFLSLKDIANKPSKNNLTAFYKLASVDNLMDYIDQFLPLLANDQKLNHKRVQEFARWLATNAPDRGPVKLAIAILGVYPGEQNKDIITTLGEHEEFTLYSAVALTNALENPETELWSLAKKVHGWGRIQIVERLRNTQNPDIKHWMLREGYNNSVMNQYLAYTCATTGELLNALKEQNPDDDLIKGAGEILDALISGGPAQDINDYEDGAEATKLYVRLIANKELSLAQFQTVSSIKDFVEDANTDWHEKGKKGWTKAVREEISELAKAVLDKPAWKEKVLNGLQSSDNYQFYVATSVGKQLGVDVWPYFFERQRSGLGDEWYHLMQTENPERIDQVIALAQRVIPLEKIATGPAQKIGLGPEYKHHSALDSIVQGLRRFPRKGWDLIKASLNSPAIRNRNMSLMALQYWGKENWPTETEKTLQAALKLEPDPKVKESIKKVINGERID